MLFSCGKRHAPATEHGSGQTVSNGSKSLIIDIHCHRESYKVGDLMKVESERVGRAGLSFGTELTKETNKKQLLDIRPKMSSVDERLADMDRQGVDIQAISISPYQYYYWAEDDICRDMSRLMNDELAEVVAATPERFVALGTIPMQNTDMAVAEMERCVKDLGMRGVEIATNINGDELSDPRLEKFWAKAEELDIVVFLHPAQFTHPERLTKHYFVNLFGHPMDTSLALGFLIFDGVMKRYPGLKICVAHGGGWLPAYSARMDHAHAARPDCREGISELPSTYLKKFYFDTMVFDPEQLGTLIEKFGADHIVLGTDYPYDMGETDPVGLVGKVAGLDQGAKDCICGLNAAKLLKIPH
jgi:aminocarboxymuconate-semialdehyde decarboxylase